MIALAVTWLRENVYASVLLLLARLYIGWNWLQAGWHKITQEGGFHADNFLQKAVENPVKSSDELVYPIYHAFLQHFALPNAELFNLLVSWGEVLVGLGLILGCLTTAAGFFGMMMNFAFMFAGTVSTNPWMILFTLFIVFSGRNAGAIGIDRYLLPLMKNRFTKSKSNGSLGF
ncbi:DoxX family protein [Brevibacillus sp. B_LB10_24]|uniref:DoxX family protein n=1 Tax=Brevibacillus sp. B_LB10_24 TaxID=3380645 RepID=UPI0038B78C27